MIARAVIVITEEYRSRLAQEKNVKVPRRIAFDVGTERRLEEIRQEIATQHGAHNIRLLVVHEGGRRRKTRHA